MFLGQRLRWSRHDTPIIRSPLHEIQLLTSVPTASAPYAGMCRNLDGVPRSGVTAAWPS